MKKVQFIKGERIYLKHLELSDLDGNYLLWLNDPEVNVNNSHHIFPYNRTLAEDYIRKSETSKDRLVLAVCTKKDDIHIGNISLQNIDFRNQSAEFAILIGEKDYWGKGYSKEAGELLVRHGFRAMNLRRIYCGTFADNLGMDKLAKYLGFREEGLRKEAFFKGGKFVDIKEYGLLKEEFYEKFSRVNP